jgi:hypothetical protein
LPAGAFGEACSQIAALLAAGGDDVSFHDRIELVRLLFDWTFGRGTIPTPDEEKGDQSKPDHPTKPRDDDKAMGTSIGIQNALEITRRTSGFDAPATDLGWLLRRIAAAVAGRPSTVAMQATASTPADAEDAAGDWGDEKERKKAAATRREQERAMDAETSLPGDNDPALLPQVTESPTERPLGTSCPTRRWRSYAGEAG